MSSGASADGPGQKKALQVLSPLAQPRSQLPPLVGKRGALLLKVFVSQASDWMVSNVSRYQNLR